MGQKSVGLYEPGQKRAFRAARAALEERLGEDLRDGDVVRLACELAVAFAPGGDDGLPAWAEDLKDVGPTVTCQNCGSHVTRQYVKVFAPDGLDRPRVCPFCKDKVRDSMADEGVREARSTRHQ